METISSMRERLSAAIDHIHSLYQTKDTPGTDPTHVFEFDDGLKIIVTMDQYEDGPALHVSARIRPPIAFNPQQLIQLKKDGEARIAELFGKVVHFKNIAAIDDEIHYWKEKGSISNN